jgi:hypothetical protein
MSHSRDLARLSLREPHSRRRALAHGGTLAVAALTGAIGSAAGQDETVAETPVIGQFVGSIPAVDGDHLHDLFVAVVADLLATGARRVRAYVCDGHGLDVWFMGEAPDAQVSLTSEEGDAALTAELATDAVGGTVTLADGTVHAFTATPPVGRGGLYTLYIRADRSAFGASASGTALFLDIRGDQATSLFAFPDGTTDVTTAPVLAYPEEGEVGARLIALDAADSHLRGTTRRKGSTKSPVLVCES